MNVKPALSWAMLAPPLTLCNASMAFAQSAEGEASLYYDLVWLALALALGFGVISRRGSHSESTSAGTSEVPTAAVKTEPRPPVHKPLRLIDLPPKEVSTDTVDSPTFVIIDNPKKTA